MSLFDALGNLASSIGHTAESLAQDVGTAASDLEDIVNVLGSSGIDVIAVAAKLSLSPVSLLRGIIDLMRGDPHQALLQHLTGPVKVVEDPLFQLHQQWGQMAQLHESTAQAINAHINDLFQGSGANDYSGPAAEALWETNQTYQKYFTTALVEHAQTQQTRHAALNDNVNDYLSQIPGHVNSLPAPMAALGVLAFETLTPASAPPDAPPEWLSGAIQWGETTEQTLASDTEETPPGPENPWWDVLVLLMVVVGAILLLLGLFWCIWWLWDHFTNHQNQQKNTTVPQPPSQPKSTTTPQPSPTHPVALSREAQDLAKKYQQQGINIDAQTIQDMLDAGYTPAEIDQIIKNLQRLYGKRGVKDALKALLGLGFTPVQAVAITNTMTQLNNPANSPASSYLKGKPGNDVYADILAAMLVQSTQTSKAKLSSLQSAIQKARRRKGSNLTQAEIIATVQSTGTSWASLPPEVQSFLLGKGIPRFAYGNAIESLVKEDLQNGYSNAYKYYTRNLGLQIEPYTRLPDGTWQYPDFRFTSNGQIVIEDLTSTSNMPDKIKYDPISTLLIAIGY